MELERSKLLLESVQNGDVEELRNLMDTEEADEFEEHWRDDLNKKKQPTIAEQMAWKLSAIYEDLKGRNKTEFANILMLQDLGAHMRKKEFKIVVENLFDMRHQDAAYTYLWYVTTFL